MNKLKLKTGLALFLFSTLALATAWYSPFKVPGSYAADQDAEWSAAANTFNTNQGVLNATGTMKQGDTMTMQYQDGTIVTYTMGPPVSCAAKCVWPTYPFKPGLAPTVKQGAIPIGGKEPQVIGLTPGVILPAMPIYPTTASTTFTPSVTITQTGAVGAAISVDFSDGTNGAGGSGSGGGGSGGSGGGWNDCGGDCPPIMEE